MCFKDSCYKYRWLNLCYFLPLRMGLYIYASSAILFGECFVLLHNAAISSFILVEDQQGDQESGISRTAATDNSELPLSLYPLWVLTKADLKIIYLDETKHS